MVSMVRPHLRAFPRYGRPNLSGSNAATCSDIRGYSLRLLVQSDNRFYPDVRYLPERTMGQVDIDRAFL
jgi:hypothetical protein